MNRYTVSSLIGEGSFGRVYKAIRKVDDVVVALKIISKRGRSNKELKNLRRECDIQSKLKHPNVIEMFESFETKNDLVVVTDFAQTDLHRYLAKNGAIPEEKSQKLICHLVSALYYLHSNRVLHRDLKPQNVLLNGDLDVKLCDFGLARNMTMGTHVLTSIKGTPLYMAPELLAEKPYDHQADLWSLGCISYEIIAGQPPFCTTSILHLVKLIKHEELKWPSFLSSNCRSFLQGLLEKDPSLRISWAQILCHPFVEGKLFISGIEAENSPFIFPKKQFSENRQSSIKAPKYKTSEDEILSKNLGSLSLKEQLQCTDNLASSQDSVNAILQSDIEHFDTDVEDDGGRIIVPFSDGSEYKALSSKSIGSLKFDRQLTAGKSISKICFVSDNSNLIVNYLNDNFNADQSTNQVPETKVNPSINAKKNSLPCASQKNSSRNKDLEKRKLSQNLDNFSLRLGYSVDVENTKKCVAKKDKLLKANTHLSEEKQNENTPPCLLPGWDSCDESLSPVIENEEWLAFLHRSIQEVLDGELESLQEQNLVSIIVAPLRNTNATPKVIEGVAQLLSLPLILGGPNSVIDVIKTVYGEVKLVPNLMFSSKLMLSTKATSDSNASLPAYPNKSSIRSISELTKEEIKTISRLYELICHLVHLKEQFISQFCDAVVILSADELLISLLTQDFKNKNAVRITNCVIALLCCVLRELPENADLVEKIIFSPKLNLINLLNRGDVLLRLRLCMLFRLLSRFSLRGLQSIWSVEVRKVIESYVDDKNDEVRMEAQCILDEIKHFSFYI